MLYICATGILKVKIAIRQKVEILNDLLIKTGKLE